MPLFGAKDLAIGCPASRVRTATSFAQHLLQALEQIASTGHGNGMQGPVVDSVIRATAAGELAPECLRRLIHSIVDTPSNRLRDDATILMLEWWPPSR